MILLSVLFVLCFLFSVYLNICFSIILKKEKNNYLKKIIFFKSLLSETYIKLSKTIDRLEPREKGIIEEIMKKMEGYIE